MVTISRYDVVDYLDSEKTIAGYLEAVMEEGGIRLFVRALPEAARARTILQLAAETGIDRKTLCRMLSDDSDMAESEYPVLSPDMIARVTRAFAAPAQA
ncbi:MAG: putative addiction module antidote protein [Holophagales bacterium]|jgi:probable addiction module antidote protein|nr:putative addiction module antidote protein [Holophagales bacterium]